MNYFFDTSALIKNYIEEIGSDIVTDLLQESDNVYVSELCIIECFSTLKRIFQDKLINEKNYENIKNEIKYDFEYFTKIELGTVIKNCEKLIDLYQLKTLDSIQLSSLLHVKDNIDYFICCDGKLLKSAEKENIKIINPNKKK